MDVKALIKSLGFNPKENAVGIFTKRYPSHGDYCIDINLEKQSIPAQKNEVLKKYL